MKSALSVRSWRPIRLSTLLPLMLGVMSLVAIAPAWAQEELMRTITVSGQGNESIATSLTQVRLGVEAQGRTAEEVQAEVARRSNAVVELVRSRNVSKLQTTGVYLSPVYDYSNNRQRVVGYTATNTISFEIATAQAGTLLDDAVNAGASRIDGVSFVASDDAMNQARQVALREATEDALAQADAVLDSLGLDRREVVSIQVNGAAPPPPIFQDASRLQSAAAESAPTPIVGGEQEVSASVTLQISY